ncbi:MAG: metallophosphoesterase [Clostridia bacterium]|nr:metallophosphoesterase [Clostridia bacterium]
MKRIVVLLLCLCMLLPMAFAVAAVGAGAEASEALFVATDKAVYRPGEPIMITATPADDQLDWVGIVPADAQGNPLTSYGSVYWEPIYAVGDKSVQEYSHPIGEEKGTALANELGMTRAELLELPAGRYFAVRVPDDMGVHAAAQQGLVVYAPFTIADKISMEKTTFLQGEAIEVTPLYKNDAKGYVGISRVANDGTPRRNILYTVVTDSNLNTKINIAAGTGNGDVSDNSEMAYKHLPAGRYVVYFVPDYNAGVTSRDISSDIYIDVLGATVEKTEFAYGEPIMVTGYGAGTDWIGIAAAPEEGKTVGTSIRWRYVVADSADPEMKGAGYGVATDITKAHVASGGVDMADLPAGEYVIFSGPNDCAASACHPCTYIPITISGSKPEAPVSATLALNDVRTGLAGGKLTVTFAESSMTLGQKPAGVKLYWADAEGNALADYGNIGNRKITGATTEIELTDSMVIPAEAKKLMVVAYNGMGEAEAVAADLPEERGYRTTGEKLASFQIVSDVHINANKAAHSNHAAALFADVKELDPDSLGIFVAGDVADSGLVSEYELFYQLWEESGLTVKPYIGIGNHEMFVNGSYNQDNYASQSANFIAAKNAMLEEAEQTNEPYYYINRGGQHFIFLATEYCGTHAYLSDAQMAWLESKLAEVAADGAPVFIMLHQGLYNTIAGTLGNEEGTVKQGWDGVICGSENFELWKAESGGNLSDHQKMHGQYEQPLRDLLAQYPSAMMFSGHSHWILESLGNIHEATEAQPNYLFNTASVAYLWTDDDEINGGHGTSEGSQGYFVTVYENCIEFRGRDFLNGTWIPNAYYRVWLDCAHEYDFACSATCKWCGENNPDVVPCDGEDLCSVTCKYCGKDSVTDAIAHESDIACDATCKYCGEDVVDAVAHESDVACDATCKYCGEDVVDAVPCDGEFACSTICTYCNNETVADAVEHDGAVDCATECIYCHQNVVADAKAHEGATACSNTCQWCGTAVFPTARHAGKYACSDTCEACGVTITPKDGHKESDELCSGKCAYCGEVLFDPAEHTGAEACSTVCRYGCGTAVEPAEDHVSAFACSTNCSVCNEEIDHEEHTGAVPCATECQYGCGTAVTPTEHTGEFACSNVCQWCDTPVDAAAHEGAAACSTVCKYGCGTAVFPTARHGGEFACSETCAACGVAITPKDVHTGAYDCSEQCKYCEIEIEPKTTHTQSDKLCQSACTVCGEDAFDAVAHEGNTPCSTVCKYGCGEFFTPAAAHTGAELCSDLCTVCGETFQPVSEHVGIADCATVCRYCGIDIDPISTEHTLNKPCDTNCAACGEEAEHDAHTGVHACSEICQWCGAEVENPDPHTGEVACSGLCVVCGAEFEPASEHSQNGMLCSALCAYCGEELFTPLEHEGAAACATTCKYGCGTAMVPTADHVGAYPCSTNCAACNEGIGHVDHEGEFDCSTLCKYGCGTAVTPDTEHTNAIACSTYCDVCGETVEPTAEHTNAIACSTYCDVCGEAVEATEAHVASYACSTACATCGEAIEPDVAHTTAYACDTNCSVCGEEVEHEEHDGEFECSTVCKYGCGTVMEDAVACVGLMPCEDEICRYCGAEIEALEHKGAYSCSTVCKYGCGTAVKPKRDHKKENACQTVCLLCGETTAKSAHKYDNTCDTECNECGNVRETWHKYTNSCDAECNVCGEIRSVVAHSYAGACDTTCEICHAEREADNHTYGGACDTTCDVCGAIREPGEHLFGEWVVIEEATTTAFGLKEHVCSVCGASETAEIPMLTEEPAGSTDEFNNNQTGGEQTTEEGSSAWIWIVVAAVAVIIVVIIVVAAKKGGKKDEDEEETEEEEAGEVEITDQAFEETDEPQNDE